MTMEAGLIEKKKKKKRDNVESVRKIIKKKRYRTTIRHREPSVPVVLQKLFNSCRDVFKGPGTVPPPQDVQNLRQILDCLKPEDVGLSKDLLFFKPDQSVIKGTPRVKYTTIYKCTNFSLCIFFLPRTTVIPLHNHPGMTVFSKLLLGSMHIKAYDWVDPVKFESYSMPSSNTRLARLKANTVFTAPCNTSVLYPTSGGNIHAFMAVTPCAVLDVLGPPYSKEDGRDCTYYRDMPYSSGSDCNVGESKEGEGSYGWLEEIDMPKDVKTMEGVEYLGPQIINNL
ncbi:plant cysteine oxidase 1-like [Telopea speciosissima]|uniref:plant cysteine oxidase 1-like n=1 Tax=Telopea speciosissima TaxID=54955 RepID=UPI001CC4BF6F|nr:plant cysteine oxidase 1-like [Telopea speciosissima]